MTICVESYIGEVGGKEGIKLEDQFVITKDGLEQLSSFPYEIDKPIKDKVIVTLGCSMTFGVGMYNNLIWPSIIEQSTEYNVLNSSVFFSTILFRNS